MFPDTCRRIIALRTKHSNGISKLVIGLALSVISIKGAATPIQLEGGVTLRPPFPVVTLKSGKQILREWERRGADLSEPEPTILHGFYGAGGDPYILVWSKVRDESTDVFPSASVLDHWGRMLGLTSLVANPHKQWVGGAVPSEAGLAGRVVVVWLPRSFLYIGLYSSDGGRIDEAFQLLLHGLKTPSPRPLLMNLVIFIAIISVVCFLAYNFVRRR